uniref:RRM domain-containing protein n=1 Tax=Rhizophagus irregularis (strain DAOM 181602 / DAOM 197198 / MUCL 43194) TaxID=747089 RepID=U9TJ79_RHIID
MAMQLNANLLLGTITIMPTFNSPIRALLHNLMTFGEHVAIFAGIPKNIKEADLLKIALHVNAKAINIPLSYNSYKPKPYAYLNFSSFESLKAAKELTIAFRNKDVINEIRQQLKTVALQLKDLDDKVA